VNLELLSQFCSAVVLFILTIKCKLFLLQSDSNSVRHLLSKACIIEPLIFKKQVNLSQLIPWEYKCILQAVDRQSPDSTGLQNMIVEEEYVEHMYPAEDKLTPNKG